MTRFRRRAIEMLRVRERPDPPPAAGGTLDVFRASRRYLTLRRVEWCLAQGGALLSILFWLGVSSGVDLPFSLPFVQLDEFTDWLDSIDIRTPVARMNGTDIMFLLESVAISGYVLQLVGTGLLLTLNWEMRWYMVSDESLRIREGLVRVREQTMTVANIQNMRVRQGPLQRLFGLSELEVHTAGGGGSASDDGKDGARNLHVGHFRGLDDAWALRDRLRDALARHRASGLGDPDEDSAAPPRHPETADDQGLRVAADALLAEARLLRASLGADHG